MKKEYKFSYCTIYIDTPNSGIYLFDSESAIGKTYLCSLIEEFKLSNEICIVNYDNYETKTKDIFNNKYSLVIFDRFDLYGSEELISSLESVYLRTPIIFDWKCCTIENIWDYKRASIIRNEGVIHCVI